MSPASQGGGLEVKRYIGSCLISGAARGPPLLPLPLVSVGVAGGGGGAFSRLAAHTQGAPLILAGRYGGRKPAQGQRAPRKQQQQQQQQQQHHQSEADAKPARAAGGVGAAHPAPARRQTAGDSGNTASDESSGPAENCLPRIIKPRKRRKKDRKPPVAAPAPASPPEASGIVTLKPYVPLCYDGGGSGRRRPERQQAAAPPPVPAPPPADSGQSRCQCRYCDPAGHIWDVRRHGYSVSLTPPSPSPALDISPFASIPLFLSAPADGDATDTDAGFFSDDLPPASSSALRRSWSSSSASSQNSDSSDCSSTARTAPISVASQALEVSTEIVTSPNGHRDIEIKFYSSSPPSCTASGDSEEDAETVNEKQSAASAAHRRDMCEDEPWSESGSTVGGTLPGDEDDDDDDDDECVERYLGGSLWANIEEPEE